jgi:hypothetical protein
MRLLKAAIPFFVGASALTLPPLTPRDDGVDSAADVEPVAGVDGIAKCHCPPARTVTKTVTVRDGPTSTPGSMKPFNPDLEKPEHGKDKSKMHPLPMPTKKPEPKPSKPEKPGNGHDKGKDRGGKNRNVVYFTNW